MGMELGGRAIGERAGGLSFITKKGKEKKSQNRQRNHNEAEVNVHSFTDPINTALPIISPVPQHCGSPCVEIGRNSNAHVLCRLSAAPPTAGLGPQCQSRANVIKIIRGKSMARGWKGFTTDVQI